METSERKVGAPEWLILIGGIFFIIVLTVSAIWQADIRWLHFFQAWMYIATIWLGLRRNRWGYFIGISAAGLWDYVGIFVNTFVANGVHELVQWIHTGHLARPDQLIAVPAWISNFLVVAGCVWAYWRRLPNKPAIDCARFVFAFALTTGFFALDMWICQPRYLGLFQHLLHPRWLF
jgi:hypothetical protein